MEEWWETGCKLPTPPEVLEIGKSMAWDFLADRKSWVYGTHMFMYRYMSWLLSKEDAYTFERKGRKIFKWIKPDYFWHIRDLTSHNGLFFYLEN